MSTLFSLLVWDCLKHVCKWCRSAGLSGWGLITQDRWERSRKRRGEKAMERIRGRPWARVQKRFTTIVSNNGPFDQTFSTHTHTSASTRKPTAIHVRFMSLASECLRVCLCFLGLAAELSGVFFHAVWWRELAEQSGSILSWMLLKYGSYCASESIWGQERSSFNS